MVGSFFIMKKLNKMKALLFDLEWVIYNPLTQDFSVLFWDIYNLTKKKNIKTVIATWADSNELENINNKINIYDFFKDVFSSVESWFKFKSDPLFFQDIAKILNTETNEMRLIDDWENGIKGAKLSWMNTFFIWSTLINYADKYWSMQDFLIFLQTI